MSSDIASLQHQIASATVITPDVIDAMNRLAELQIPVDVASAIELAKRAAAQAKDIAYLSGQARALRMAGLCASTQRNYPAARDWYQQAEALYTALNDEHGIAEVEKRLGIVAWYEGEYSEALARYQKALEIRKALKDDLDVADLYVNSAAIYSLQGNYLQAIKMYMNALETYELLGMDSRIASTTSNMALVYRDLKNYDEALKMFERALHIRRQANDLIAISDIWNSVGNMYQDQGNFKGAMDMFQRALEYREQSGDKIKIAYSSINLGNLYKTMGEHERALYYYTKSLSLLEESNEKRGLIQSYLNLGELYFETDEFESAHHYLDATIALCKETGLKSELRKAYETLSRLLAKEGDYRSAYEMHLKYMVLDKEISNIETNRQISQMTLQSEIKQKERDAEQERIKNAELTKAYTSLENEKKRSEELLNNILPEEVSEELKQSGRTKARSFAQVTVMFADIRNFTKISELLSAEEIVDGIDEYFEEFDKIVEKNKVEKIKTIGDAYLCAGGIPVAIDDHAERVVNTAIAFLNAAAALKEKRQVHGKPVFEFRIGIHTGPLVAGVVGIRKFAYDIWGDTVNTASRMQQNGEPNRINISESTYQLVKEKYNCVYRGEIEAKNKGKLNMYFIDL